MAGIQPELLAGLSEEEREIITSSLGDSGFLDDEEGAPSDEGTLDAEFEWSEDAPSAAITTIAGEEPEEEDVEDDDLRRAALTALYGSEFPLIDEKNPDLVEEEKWVAWVKDRWQNGHQGKWRRLHEVQRLRLMRKGIQWLSAIGFQNWREPVAPKDSVRAVYNMLEPALDQRVQLISEQRPGFQTKPKTQDPDDKVRAEAQQIALEYTYDEQAMSSVLREALYWTGTDGCAFLHSFWDPDAGPWHESMSGGQPAGDPRTEVIKIEEWSVSPNASANSKPFYGVIRKAIPKSYAVHVHGPEVAEADNHSTEGTDFMTGSSISTRIGLEVPGDRELYEDQDIVDRFTMYVDRCEYLPKGLTIIVVGSKLVWIGPLLFSTIPVIRLTDGSTDPSYFPRAIAEGWIDHQIRINALISKWVESVRHNVGGRFLAKPRSIAQDTLVGGVFSQIEVRSAGPIGDSIVPLQPFTVGNDVKELLALEKKAFEEKSGYNDASRGSFSSETSGRAILAQRESLERIFAEPVAASARALCEWAKVQLHIMAWGYDEPRTVGIFGTSRPDMSRTLTQDDFDGVADVGIDPETLMPLPRALRLFLLDQMLERGAIDLREYRRRLPFAYTRDMHTPDEDQSSRAKRIADAIRNQAPVPPMFWQDNEAIHQDVLERDIVFRDDLPMPIRQAALIRWNELANQFMMKQQGMGPPTGGMMPPQQPQQGAGGPMPGLSPRSAPLLMNNPGFPAAPVATTSGFSDDMNRQSLVDRTSPY